LKSAGEKFAEGARNFRFTKYLRSFSFRQQQIRLIKLNLAVSTASKHENRSENLSLIHPRERQEGVLKVLNSKNI
jgi:hypothetical protein